MGQNLKKVDPPPVSESNEPLCVKYGRPGEDLIDLGIDPKSDSEQHYFISPEALTETIEDVVVKKNRSFLLVKIPWEGTSINVSQDLFDKHASPEAKRRKDHYLKTVPPVKEDGDYELSDFNYHFDDQDRLRHKETNEPFYYISERHYIAMGDAILHHIQERMKNEFKMEEVFVDPEKHCNIFFSPKWDEKEKVILLIQGSGAVRAGQWARALCFNDSLKTGACFDYIQQAYDEGYGVIVLNPNLTARRKNEETPKVQFNFLDPEHPPKLNKDDYIPLTNSSSDEEQARFVYENYVTKSQATQIFIIAHSYGGWTTINLLENTDVLKKLVAIGFTDAVHRIQPQKLSEQTVSFVKNNAVNWIRSKAQLNQVLKQEINPSGCELRSAGTESHELTSSCCQKYLFKYFLEKSGP